MVVVGYISVGEFYYVYYQFDGMFYCDYVMELVFVNVVIEVGICIIVFDICYLYVGLGVFFGVDQKRFGDGSVEGWLECWCVLCDVLFDFFLVMVGVVLYLVWVVSFDEMVIVVSGLLECVFIYIYVFEQFCENIECLVVYGLMLIVVLD